MNGFWKKVSNPSQKINSTETNQPYPIKTSTTNQTQTCGSPGGTPSAINHALRGESYVKIAVFLYRLSPWIGYWSLQKIVVLTRDMKNVLGLVK